MMPRRWICAIAVAACTPAAPLSLTPAEASAIVDEIGRGASTIDICTEAGRATFRAAVGLHSASREREGVVWPNFADSLGSDREMDGAELAVMGAIIAGYVGAEDLAGEAREGAQMIDLSVGLDDQRRVFRDGMQSACAEVMQLQQLMAREQVAAERAEQRAQRLEDRGDTERAYDVRQRYYLRAQQARSEMQSLMDTIEAKIAAARV
ncbi:hypothetical protein U91I_03547 [alpha proteobacterium U9-1i]|nr:hypothetical protein U91I_03547 [alpha proteobacterium U9-1i]